MVKFYAIEKADGGVVVMQVTPIGFDAEGKPVYPKPEREVAQWHPNTRAECFGLDQGPTGPKNLKYREISLGEIPSDRTFRNAWSPDLSVDMLRAREIWRARLRAMRGPKLDTLDRLYARAMGQKKPVEADAIEVKRQALRDVPADPKIEAANTPEELKTVVPKVLSEDETVVTLEEKK